MFAILETQDLVTLVPWTFIAQICNLFIQVMLIKKFLFKPVQKMIKDRQDEIDGLFLDAENAKSEAEALKTDYESKLQNARETSAEMIRSAAATANKTGEEIIRSAKADAQALKDKAARDIELERKKALNEMKDDVSAIALSIAEKVVQKEINAQDQQAFIDEFIEKIGDVQ